MATCESEPAEIATPTDSRALTAESTASDGLTVTTASTPIGQPDSDNKFKLHDSSEKSKIVAPRNSTVVFLFVNRDSGGLTGHALLQANTSHVTFVDPNVQLYFQDIQEGKPGDKSGFHVLKAVMAEIPPTDMIRVVVAGGDGSVKWCAEELILHEIDLSRVVLGVLPLGTGNDFARALRWHGPQLSHLFGNGMFMLRRLCSLWAGAQIVFHDVWEVCVTLYNEGSFKKIDKVSRLKVEIPVEEDREERTRTQTFKLSNYFSIGVESRIGIGFDKRRRSATSLNKMVYFSEGFKKSMFRRTMPVQKLIASMTAQCGGREDIVFTTDPKSPHTKLKSAMSLVAINIPSFAAGADIWGKCAGKRTGLIQSSHTDLPGCPQVMGDGKLEFLTFSSTLTLSLEQAFSGRGHRVHQGEGPFTFHFRPLDPNIRTYFQVDGEFFQISCPKMIKITHDRRVKTMANGLESSTDNRRFVYCEK